MQYETYQNYTYRLSEKDLAMLALVAQNLQRTKADTLRTVIREVYKVMLSDKDNAKPNKAAHA
jgi:hypothetical protein